MIKKLVFLTFFLGSPHLFGLSLEEALKAAQSHPSIAGSRAMKEASKWEASSVGASYTPEFFASALTRDDRSFQLNPSSGQSRSMRKYETGVRSLVSTGTQLELKMEHVESDIQPHLPQPPEYPRYESTLSLTAKQPLIKNAWARNIKLLEQSANEGAKIQDHQHQSAQNNLQSGIEQAYWKIVALREQLKRVRTLKGLSAEFRSQMARRVDLGRADLVDLASAEAEEVRQLDVETDLETGLQTAITHFQILTGINLVDAEKLSNGLDTKRNLSKSLEQLLSEARQNRGDLKTIESQKRLAEITLDQKKNEDRFELNLMGGYSQNGNETSSSKSLNQSLDPEYNTWFVGLELSITLGKSRSSHEVLAQTQKALAAEYQIKNLILEMEREIRSGFNAIQSAERKIKNAERKIELFRSRLRLEREKLQQARSERVNVIRYEMEVLSSEIDLMRSWEQYQLAIGQIKTATQTYETL